MLSFLTVFLIVFSLVVVLHFEVVLVSSRGFSGHVGGVGSLGFNVTRGEALRRYILAFHTGSGGFKDDHFYPRASVTGTRFSVLALKLLGALTPSIVDSVYNYILGLYDDRGFFYGENSDAARVLVYIVDTWDAIETLHAIGKLDDLDKAMKESIINWVLSMYDEEENVFMETYNPRENKIWHSPFIDSTLAGVRILQLFGALDKINKSKVIKAIYRRFYQYGHFGDIFDSILENYYGVVALTILGGLNESVKSSDAKWLMSLVNPSTGIDASGNLADTAGIVITLSLLGHLDLLPVNKTVETIFSMQGHKYGGFLCLLDKGDNLDNYLGTWSTHDILKSIFLLNASNRLSEPFYVEHTPDFSEEWSDSSDSGSGNGGDSGSNSGSFIPPFPGDNEDLSPPIWGFFVLVIIFGLAFLVVAPILYIIDRKLSKTHRAKRSKRKKSR